MDNLHQTYLSSPQSTNGGGVTKSFVTTYLPYADTDEQLFSMKLNKTHNINNLMNYIYQRGFEIVKYVREPTSTPGLQNDVRITHVILRKQKGVSNIPLNHPIQHY